MYIECASISLVSWVLDRDTMKLKFLLWIPIYRLLMQNHDIWGRHWLGHLNVVNLLAETFCSQSQKTKVISTIKCLSKRHKHLRDKHLLKFLKWIRSLLYICFNLWVGYILLLRIYDRHLLKRLGCARYLLKFLNVSKLYSNFLKVMNIYSNFPITWNNTWNWAIIIDLPIYYTLPLVFYNCFYKKIIADF